MRNRSTATVQGSLSDDTVQIPSFCPLIHSKSQKMKTLGCNVLSNARPVGIPLITKKSTIQKLKTLGCALHG